jgi:hypothetical protein
MPRDAAELVRRVGHELLVEHQMEGGIGRGLLEPSALMIVPLPRPDRQIAAEQRVGGIVERGAMDYKTSLGSCSFQPLCLGEIFVPIIPA